MTILGLDPGIARTGFGAITVNGTPRFLRCGLLTTPAGEATEDRLLTLGQDLAVLIAELKPALAVVESIFFGANIKTAVLTAQTSGVLLYVLRQHHIPTRSLTPLQIKSRLTGYGAADKHQVQTVVTKRLQLTQVPQPDDAADALAAALCMAEESFALRI